MSSSASQPQQIHVSHQIPPHTTITLSSQFCSGNLSNANITSFSNSSAHIKCATNGDVNAPKYSTWFYFWVRVEHDQSPSGTSVTDGSSFTLHFTIQNLNAQKKLFKQGMKPVIRCGSRGEWYRLPEKMLFEEMEDAHEDEDQEDPSTATSADSQDKFQLRFKFCIPQEKRHKKWYIAYCYPWSVADNERLLTQLHTQYASHRKIYFHRETLIHSLEGRNVEVLTVSSHKGVSAEREESLPNCYPDRSQLRAYRFPRKKTYLLTARIHPGETPASHIFNGFLKFILHPTDPRAAILRNLYVFKFIPLLNPDGVSRGHYRADTQGLNLNRFYKDPTPTEHPSIYATKCLAGYLTEHANLHMYMDLHAHATKRGHFIFGNALPEFEQQLENLLYSKLVALNTQHLDFHAGNFSEKSMTRKDKRDGLSKDGTGRVGMYQHTGLVHCYTLEGNYNTGKGINHIGSLPSCGSVGGGQYAPELPTYTKQCPKYDIAIFEDVGKALCTALLDMTLGDENPYSRLRSTTLRNMEGVRKWTTKIMNRKKKFWRDASKKRVPLWGRSSDVVGREGGGGDKVEDEGNSKVADKNERESDSEDDSDKEAEERKEVPSTKSRVPIWRRNAERHTDDEVVNNSADESSSSDGRSNASPPDNGTGLRSARVISITEHTPPSKKMTAREMPAPESARSPLVGASSVSTTETRVLRTSQNFRRPSTNTNLTTNPTNNFTTATTQKPSTSIPRKRAIQKKLHGRSVVCHSVSTFERLTQPKAPRIKNPQLIQSFNQSLVKFDPTFDADEEEVQAQQQSSPSAQRKSTRTISARRVSVQVSTATSFQRFAIADGLVYAQYGGEYFSSETCIEESEVAFIEDTTGASKAAQRNAPSIALKKKKRVKKKKRAGSGSSRQSSESKSSGKGAPKRAKKRTVQV